MQNQLLTIGLAQPHRLFHHPTSTTPSALLSSLFHHPFAIPEIKKITNSENDRIGLCSGRKENRCAYRSVRFFELNHYRQLTTHETKVKAYAVIPASSTLSSRLPGKTDSLATRLYIRGRSTVTKTRPSSSFASAPGRWAWPSWSWPS